MEALCNVPGISSPTELVACIIDRFGPGVPKFKLITVRDLNEPKSDFVVTSYMEYLRLLKINTKVTADQLKRFEYSDAYTDALLVGNIFSALGKFFARQNAHDFSMFDLVSPTYKRTYGGLAVMENYINFWQLAKEELSPEILAIKGRKDSFREMCEKKETLTAETAKNAIACSERAHKVMKLTLSLKEIKISTKELTSRINEMITKETELAKKLEEEKIKSNTLEVGINQLKEELNLQMKMVVPDPGQIVRDDACKKKKLMEMNEKVDNLKEKLEIVRKDIQLFEQMFEIKSHFEEYMEISSDLKNVWEEKQLSTIKEQTLQIQSSEEMRDEIKKKELFLKKLMANLSSERAKADGKLATMEETVRQLESNRAKLDKKNTADGKTCDKLQPLIEEVQNEAQKWIDIKTKCEARVIKKKNRLDEKMKKEVAEIDNVLLKVHETSNALNSKVTKELAEVTKLLNEQKAKDAAEGRTYNPK